jgi:hypothetical protein
LHGKLQVLPQNQGNAIWGTGTSASALAPGVVVGSKGPFQPSHEFMAGMGYGCDFGSCGYGSGGQWKLATRLYLGLQFTIQGQTHFGWARVSVSATDRGVYAAVTGYVYESVPNTSIVTGQTQGTAKKKKTRALQANPVSVNRPAPEPASLGLLAHGFLGLDVWRRRDAVRIGQTGVSEELS